MRVLLTGAASGIGACVASKLQAQGHDLTVLDINKPEASQVHWIETDLSDPAAIDTALGQLDGLYDAVINNAGLPPRAGLELKVLQINFYGLQSVLDGVLDHLAQGASVVNVASRAGAAWRDNINEVKALLATTREDLPEFIASRAIDPIRAYNLSKEAVIVLSMARAQQMVTRGARINSVSPAAVSTGILADFKAAFGEKVARNIERAGRPGTPDEIASVIAFLASPDSAWIKGQDIVIDGGMSAMALTDALQIPHPVS